MSAARPSQILTRAPAVPHPLPPLPPGPPDGGGSAKVNPPVSLLVVESGFVTTTSTAPPACAGVLALIVPALVIFTLVAADPPSVSVAPVAKFAPRSEILVPPAVGAVLGSMVERSKAVEPPILATKASLPPP